MKSVCTKACKSTIYRLCRFRGRGLAAKFAALLSACCLPVIALAQLPVRLTPLAPIEINDATPTVPPGYNAISVDTQPFLYLTDQRRNQIVKADTNGTVIRRVGGFGWEVEQFDRPAAIWAENSLDVFVADYNNNRIQRFDRNLNFVASLVNDSNLDEKLQFGLPVAVAFSKFSELIIAEHDRNRVLRFSAGGVPAQSFGDYNWGSGTLEEPVRLCLGADDHLFVADRGRRAIIRFDYFGNFIQEIRHPKLSVPAGLATQGDWLFVLDAASRQVLVFEIDGDFLLAQALDTAPPAPGEEARFDLALARNRLYVLFGHLNLVQRYHLTRTFR